MSETTKKRKRAEGPKPSKKPKVVVPAPRLFHARWAGSSVFMAARLVVATSEDQVQDVLSEELTGKQMQTLVVMPLDTSASMAIYAGAGPLEVKHADAASGQKNRVFIAHNFKWYEPWPPVAVVFAPDLDAARQEVTKMLTAALIVRTFGEGATNCDLQELRIEKGAYAQLTNGEPIM